MFLRLSLFASLVLSLVIPSYSSASSTLEELKLARVSMFRAAISVISHRGERIDQELRNEANSQINSLKESLTRSINSDGLAQSLDSYATFLEDNLSYDPLEEDYPWEFNLNLSTLLRNLDNNIIKLEKTALRNEGANHQLMENAVRLEYMAVRYLARSYTGELHTEAEGGYFEQDLGVLAKELTLALENHLDDSPQAIKAKRAWKFIEPRYSKYDLELAPFIVHRKSWQISNLMVEQSKAAE
ncbi:hypothetical protein [Parendozoicomonas sp. Alg238-R29]|uniref:hypothetical protein n=1 Tax=Parendozoicomonas sp. Alg238-R29 TaxID=2993446 RepID=UPI00248D5BAF|nr:hypothetical protein [Parendozoicomonas sp. Alg238-R29]